MTEVIDPQLTKALSGAAFSLFAVQQPIGDADLAQDGRSHRLSMAAASTPDWFSAAATKSSSLLEMAPELRGFTVDDAIPEDQARTDLIHMYGDDDLRDNEVAEEMATSDIKWNLLKEVADIDD
jgi:hypothetical protein